MALTVVGSIAFDSVRTPFGERERMLGGSAVHFALAASFFTDVRVVGPVGEDFAPEHLAVLSERGIETEDIERVPGGETFVWRGHYEHDMNVAHTDDTQLNVFADFQPKLSRGSCEAQMLFLGNIQPELQRDVRRQSSASFAALDSMNLWIETARDSLVEAISEVDCLLLNDAELRMLTERAEPRPGCPGGDRDRTRGCGRQARRVRGGAVHRRRVVRDPRAAAGGCLGPDRRRRQLRRRLPRLPRRRPSQRGARRSRPAPGDGVRVGDGLVQRRGLRDRPASLASPRPRSPSVWPRSSASPTSRRRRSSAERAGRRGPGGILVAARMKATERSIEGEAMADEQRTSQDGSGAATAERTAETLTVTDNRTGESYELEVTDGTVRALDLRQIKVSEDDFGLMTYDPAFTNTASCRSAITYIDGDAGILAAPRATRSSSSASTRATSRSPTCWSSASFRPPPSSSAGSSTSPTTPSSTRTSSTSWRRSATTPTRWGCCSPASARCRPSTPTRSRSTIPRSATWRRSG